MSTDSIGGASSAYDRQSFGAQVVSATLDAMNGQGQNSSPAITDKESLGAAVVSKTLDSMNGGGHNGSDMSQTYEFNKTVLGGHAAGLGALTDINI